MAFDWRTLVELANDLADQASQILHPEPYQRTAVGRAYFSAFGYAFQYAVQYLQYDPKESPEDHGRLREHLRGKKRKNAARSPGPTTAMAQ